MQTTIKQVETRAAEASETKESAQEKNAILELSNLELSLVGGGVGAVIFL